MQEKEISDDTTIGDRDDLRYTQNDISWASHGLVSRNTKSSKKSCYKKLNLGLLIFFVLFFWVMKSTLVLMFFDSFLFVLLFVCLLVFFV